MRPVRTHRIDLTPLLTHLLPLEEIEHAYKMFGARERGVLNVAIRVS